MRLLTEELLRGRGSGSWRSAVRVRMRDGNLSV